MFNTTNTTNTTNTIKNQENDISKILQKFSFNMFNSVIALPLDSISNVYNTSTNLSKAYVLSDYSNISELNAEIIDDAIKDNFILPEEISKTFYETWNNVLSKTPYQLFIDQIQHYASTYGTDFQDTPYVPNEHELELPDILIKNIKVVNVLSVKDFKNKMSNLITLNIALNSEEISTIIDIIDFLDVDVFIEQINNKELKLAIYKSLNILPNDPEEFIKYVVYTLTNDTLYIKNDETINNVKNEMCRVISQNNVKALFDTYLSQDEYAYKKLGTIFNRNKKIFLALKSSTDMNRIVNKIAKMSKTYHKPKIVPNYQKITSGELSYPVFQDTIDNLDISYLIKVINSLSYKMLNVPVNIYTIRNNKVFSKKTKTDMDISLYRIMYDYCKEVLTKKLNKRIQDLKINIIPGTDLSLALPTSGKQFVGNIPWFSTYKTDMNNELAIGVYWEDSWSDNANNVDLDLSCTNSKEKIGWNASYSNSAAIYSGDMTSAPNGAIEAIRFNNFNDSMYTLNLNFYNAYDSNNIKCKYKLFASKKDYSYYNEDSLNPNDIIWSKDMLLTNKHELIGFVSNIGFTFGKIQMPSTSVADVTPIDLEKAIYAQIISKITFDDLDLDYTLYTDSDDTSEVLTLDLNNPEKSLLLKLIS